APSRSGNSPRTYLLPSQDIGSDVERSSFFLEADAETSERFVASSDFFLCASLQCAQYCISLNVEIEAISVELVPSCVQNEVLLLSLDLQLAIGEEQQRGSRNELW